MADALVIFKPDASYRLAVRANLWRWLSTEYKWKLEALTWYQPPTDLIESHYDFLQGRPFFPWLVDFMTALPLVVGRITASAEALEGMRYDLGETRIAQSRPGSLREKFGIFGGINCVHLSDAPETGNSEVERWRQFLPLDKIDIELERESERPDNTFHLRSLATQVASGIHPGLALEKIKDLLAEETDLAGEQREAFYRVILGALTA
jgi:nucleoside-diphosphate kinase